MRDFKVETPNLPGYQRNLSKIEILKHNLLTDTLNYNFRAASKQKQQKYQHHNQQKQSYQTYNHQLNQQIQFDRIQQLKKKKLIQNQLKEEYNRQILRKQQQINKLKDQEYSYFKAEKEYSNFAQERRMRQLAKMYKRPTYQGVLPYKQKIKTEPSESLDRKPIYYNKKQQVQQNYKGQNPQIKQKQQISFKSNQNNSQNKLTFNNNINIELKPQNNRPYSTNKVSNYVDSLDQLKKMDQKLKQQYRKQLDHQISYKNNNLKKFSPY